MTTQPVNQRLNSNTQILLLETWLWVFACTLSVGMLGGRALVPPGRGARPGDFVLPFAIGGIIGGIIAAKFLPYAVKWGKIGRVLSLILPILVILLVISQVEELGALLILSILGILGSAYVIWIPRWTRRLSKKTHEGCWDVAFALALIILNTFIILVIFIWSAAWG